MRWLGGRRPEAPGDRPEPTASAPVVHRSLALAAHFAEIDPEERLHVLDLGPAVGANVDFLSRRFVCKLEVGDLYRSLVADPRRFNDPDAEAATALMHDALAPAGEPYDLVLAWDLLNYLTRPQIRALATLLAASCRPGARLFAMVVTRGEMPPAPLVYLLGEDGELVYRDLPGQVRPAPRYRPAEIDQLTPGFTVDRSFLLRHGIQEFLLLRSDQAPPRGWSSRPPAPR